LVRVVHQKQQQYFVADQHQHHNGADALWNGRKLQPLFRVKAFLHTFYNHNHGGNVLDRAYFQDYQRRAKWVVFSVAA
jgi:hypothetical protein